ncbi:uncharacterized protein LOC116203065 isoform X1 [Punica granatum]|uniref:Uncharacterized protein LOC116203065 isoform X1 n=1 Tax=Punica granatum TaxID=22663 RepID=A0A6P8D2H2_PUNGR|nr:uncharacterized protein LOC116203065 isoform X1 [Punica granatum]
MVGEGRGQGQGQGQGIIALPGWLQGLLREKFFNACIIHEEARKNEKNIFCLDCSTSFCPHCFSLHSSHRLLQIRRYVYHDVLRLDDAAKLFDCSSVQTYITNSAKVVFLRQRPQTRQCRGSGNICCTCDRPLQDPYLFCSLYCKIDYLWRTEGGLSRNLRDCNFLPLPEDAGLMTPDTVLEPAPTSSGSGGGYGGVGCRTLACTAATDFAPVVRKKRTSVLTCHDPCQTTTTHEPARPVCGPASENSAGLMNRRKKTPHRAPLY